MPWPCEKTGKRLFGKGLSSASLRGSRLGAEKRVPRSCASSARIKLVLIATWLSCARGSTPLSVRLKGPTNTAVVSHAFFAFAGSNVFFCISCVYTSISCAVCSIRVPPTVWYMGGNGFLAIHARCFPITCTPCDALCFPTAGQR